MSSLKLTYKDIALPQAEDTYCTLFHCKKWPLAEHAHNSKALSHAFGNLAVEVNAPMTAEVPTLMQNKPHVTGNQTKKPGNCNKCWKPGHWANECPDKQQGSNPRFQRIRAIVSEMSVHLASLVGIPYHQPRCPNVPSTCQKFEWFSCHSATLV